MYVVCYSTLETCSGLQISKPYLKIKTTKQSRRHIYLLKGVDHDDEFFWLRSEKKKKKDLFGRVLVSSTDQIDFTANFDVAVLEQP